MARSLLLFRQDYSAVLRPGEQVPDGVQELFAEIDWSPLQMREGGKAALTALRLAGITLLWFSAPEVSFVWRRRRRTARNRRIYALVSNGAMSVGSAGVVADATADQVVAVRPGSDPVDLVFASGGAHGFILSVDHNLLGYEPASDANTMSQFEYPHASIQASVKALLSAVVATVRPDMNAASAAGVHHLLVETANTLDLYAVAQRAASEDELFQKAIAAIEFGCGDQRLNSETIAATMSVSLRTLQRSFSAHNTSPAKEIRAARLRAAREYLEQDPTLSLAAAARKSGFSDESALRRGLKATRDAE